MNGTKAAIRAGYSAKTAKVIAAQNLSKLNVAAASPDRGRPIAHCAGSRGTTYQNRANLAGAFLQQIIKKYEGTRLGRQELNAELLDDVPGAPWSRALIEAERETGLGPSTFPAQCPWNAADLLNNDFWPD